MNSIGNKPVSVGDWISTFFLLAIPVVNLIMLLVWAFGGSVHPSKENYSRVTLILGIGVFVLAGVLMILATLISFPGIHLIH